MISHLFLQFHPEEQAHDVDWSDDQQIKSNTENKGQQTNRPEFGGNAPIQLTDVIANGDDYRLVKNIKRIKSFIYFR